MNSIQHSVHKFTFPVLAMTGGDPCGIGPEVILKALARIRPTRVRLLVIGDRAVFEQTARRLHQPLPNEFIDLAHPWSFTTGRSTRQSGRASLAYLERAVTLLRQGVADGLVTAPVTKGTIERSGRPFHGHTEYLSEALGGSSPVMMFVSPHLRVVLLTRHLALRDVPDRVTTPLLRQTIRTTVDSLRNDFRIRRPRLAICGLNPHAGEGGLFGREERRVLLPLLHEFTRDGVRLDGPLAADGFFANPRGYDAVVCWYHDQALIPFKMLARDRGCQLTLGLPVVRTSPDHGTALDIAGKNLAHPGSMRYAIELAAELVKRRS